MSHPENIEAIEKRLWSAADTLRANSNHASNEYFLPVMGLIFLRHAYSRYLAVKDNIEANLPTRGGKKRPLTKEDFSQQSAIFLRKEAQFDSLVALPDSEDIAGAIIEAMESIENDYRSLDGTLPKNEYQELGNEVIGQILRIFNLDELKRISGDVFGRIYEYFLTRFADQKAHDGGEFFTPSSLVSLIANIIEPERGFVLDPACGSGGMFVQSARFMEKRGQSPTDLLTFRGLEKNPTTIRLAKMNLAVHGLEGNIKKAITYYEDPHEMVGTADYVMANPPFNVDEIDADKIKNDRRLPFGIPGVNKSGKVSNGNYVWISYFYSYLSEKGRGGFVMSSQASSAGGGEAQVRRKLIETGDVDVMVAIGSNFFYTRTVPCELWFFNRAKPEERRDKVLMLDARKVYRKVTRKIYDFSTEQQQNLLAVVWLYRGETQRYLDLIAEYCTGFLREGAGCFGAMNEDGDAVEPLRDFLASVTNLRHILSPLLHTIGEEGAHVEAHKELIDSLSAFEVAIESFKEAIEKQQEAWDVQEYITSETAKAATDNLTPLAESSRDLLRRIDAINKITTRLIEACEKDHNAKADNARVYKDIRAARNIADTSRREVAERLERVSYLRQQAQWLTERFPDAKLRDVKGLVKLVSRSEIEANDWSLTPGRYVGVAPETEDEDFDFKETMLEIHAELRELNAEAIELAARIEKNFEGLMM